MTALLTRCESAAIATDSAAARAGAGRAKVTARVKAVAIRVLLWPARAWRARALLQQMSVMSDRELLDIGLLRSDLNDAKALYADEEPGSFLDRRVAARIASSRAWW